MTDNKLAKQNESVVQEDFAEKGLIKEKIYVPQTFALMVKDS